MSQRWRPPRRAPPVIIGGVLEVGTYRLARRLRRGRMIGEIVWSQTPNKVLLAVPPLVDLAEQLLPRYYRSALSQLCSDYCHQLQSYRRSVGWANDSTCPDCHAADHMVAHLFSCPTHPTDLAPGGCVGGTSPDSPIPGGPPTVCRTAPLHCRSTFIPFLLLPSFPPSALSPLWNTAGPLHVHPPPPFLTSSSLPGLTPPIRLIL